jgi:hypothetical protein
MSKATTTTVEKFTQGELEAIVRSFLKLKDDTRLEFNLASDSDDDHYYVDGFTVTTVKETK